MGVLIVSRGHTSIYFVLPVQHPMCCASNLQLDWETVWTFPKTPHTGGTALVMLTLGHHGLFIERVPAEVQVVTEVTGEFSSGGILAAKRIRRRQGPDTGDDAAEVYGHPRIL